MICEEAQLSVAEESLHGTISVIFDDCQSVTSVKYLITDGGGSVADDCIKVYFPRLKYGELSLQSAVGQAVFTLS